MNRYKAWCLRRAARAECSPALWVIGGLLITCLTAYHYRNAIIHTLLIIMVCMSVGLAVFATGAVVTSIVRWRKIWAQSRIRTDLPSQNSDTGPISSGCDQTLADAAVTLADDTIVLRWSPDGKTLEGVRE